MSTTVLAGAIGKVGLDPSSASPAGEWTINQRASASYVLDGNRFNRNSPNDIGTDSPHATSGTYGYTYWDHPGAITADVRKSFSGRFAFTITATNRKETCKLKFLVDVSYGTGQQGSVSWGRIR